MSKKALWVFSFSAAAFFSMPLIYANDAPVVDVTQQAQPQAVEPDNSSDSAQTPMVNTISPNNAPVQNNSVVTPVTSNVSGSKRLARLDQQVQNLVRMNLPQQITELQQKVEALQGKLQEQERAIEELKQNKSSPSSAQNEPEKTENPSCVTPTRPPTAASPEKETTPEANSAPEKTMDEASTYRNAFDLLIKKQYGPAGEGFENYLKQYPKGQFLVNAHYWLGEIYLLQKKSPDALMQFQAVVNQFPNSSKVADAKLKIAQILAQTGQVPEARQQLITIIKKYPGSTAAQLAKIQLQQISPKKKRVNE